VVALAVALVLTVTVLDVALSAPLGWIFDVGFVALSLAAALMVRPPDMFTVGVLPPLLMLGDFLLLALTRTPSIADPGDNVVQAVATGLGHHSVALFIGYAACLGTLALRRHIERRRGVLPHPASPMH